MFTIISGSTIIGESELENGDPPMGVAYGVFVPSTGFDEQRSSLLVAPEQNDADTTTWEELTVRAPDGRMLRCAAAALTEFGTGKERQYEVVVVGIEFPPYDELFPALYDAYWNTT